MTEHTRKQDKGMEFDRTYKERNRQRRQETGLDFEREEQRGQKLGI